MNRKVWLVVSLFVLAAIALTACAGGAAAPTAAPAGGAAAPTAAATGGAAQNLKAVLVINGVFGDKSFFDSAKRGVDRAAQELGVNIETVELGLDPAKWQPGLEDVAANKQYDILITGTFQMVDFLAAVAPKYPNKKFVIFDAPVDYAKCGCQNVYSITYKQNEGSYVAGIYAGLMAQQKMDGTNDKKLIGAVGGQDIPVINDFIVGYKQGAKAVGIPDGNVLVQYAGNWNDPAKGKEITKAMYQQGATIVFNIAGGTGEGIFEAAKEDGRWAIGVDSDAWLLHQDKPEIAARILTSMQKNVDNSLFRMFQMALKNTVPWGKAEGLGLTEGGVSLSINDNYNKLTPKDVQDKVTQAISDVTSGKVKVDTVFQ